MSSILKVDTIQTTAGAAPTAKDLGFAAGSVIQVANGLLATGVNNSTASYVDTGLTATITPKFASSKILIICNMMSVENNTASEGAHVKLVRGSTDLSEWGRFMGYTRTYMTSHPSITYLDSPATTSATVYKVQFKRGQGGGQVNVNSNTATSSITLMEIAQ